METSTVSNVVNTRYSPDGMKIGQTTSDYLGFYGTTPVQRPTAAAQANITDGSGGTASATTGVQDLTSSYNSTLLADALATIIAQGNALRAAMVSVGLIKGS